MLLYKKQLQRDVRKKMQFFLLCLFMVVGFYEEIQNNA